MTERFAKPTLRDGIRVVRERRWLILAVVAIFVGVAMLFEGLSTRSYAPYADIQLGLRAPEGQFLATRVSRPALDFNASVVRKAERARRADVLADARRRLDEDDRPFLHSQVYEAQALPFPNRIRITVYEVDAERGGRLAGALAAALAADLRKQDRRAIDRAIAELRQTGDQTRRKKYPRSTFGALDLIDTRRTELAISRLTVIRSQVDTARVAGEPVVPFDPFYSPGQRGAGMINLGLSLGLLLAFFLDATDGRQRQGSRLARASGLSLLGATPRRSRRQKHRARERLAADRLRSAVETAISGGMVLVTSAGQGEGKSTVAADLARAMARAGRRVVLVDGDLRRPVLAGRLDAREAPGFAELLAGADPASCVQDLQTQDGAIGFVAAGHRTRTSSDQLAAGAGRAALEQLAARCDLVVVDGPPAMAASDALEMARLADGVVLCGRSGRTRSLALRSAAEVLHAAGAPLLGLVAVGVPLFDPAVKSLEHDVPAAAARPARGGTEVATT